jgi:hypothetical protein
MPLQRTSFRPAWSSHLVGARAAQTSHVFEPFWLLCFLCGCSSRAFLQADITAADEALTQPLLSPYDAAAADAAEAGVPLLLEKDEPVVKEEAQK